MFRTMVKAETKSFMNGIADSWDTKAVRRVRTPAGEKRFGQPIGSIIIGGGAGKLLSHVKLEESDYAGFDLVSSKAGRKNKGKKLYIGKYDGESKVVVTDEEGNEDLYTGTLEGAFKFADKFYGGTGGEGDGPDRPAEAGAPRRPKKKPVPDDEPEPADPAAGGARAQVGSPAEIKKKYENDDDAALAKKLSNAKNRLDRNHGENDKLAARALKDIAEIQKEQKRRKASSEDDGNGAGSDTPRRPNSKIDLGTGKESGSGGKRETPEETQKRVEDNYQKENAAGIKVAKDNGVTSKAGIEIVLAGMRGATTYVNQGRFYPGQVAEIDDDEWKKIRKALITGVGKNGNLRQQTAALEGLRKYVSSLERVRKSWKAADKERIMSPAIERGTPATISAGMRSASYAARQDYQKLRNSWKKRDAQGMIDAIEKILKYNAASGTVLHNLETMLNDLKKNQELSRDMKADRYMGDLSYKSVPVGGVEEVDESTGEVQAIVAVTGIKDNVNDIILPGAFQKSLHKRTPKGVWHHNITESVARTDTIEELAPGHKDLPMTLPNGDPWPAKAGALMVKMQFNLNTQRGRDAYEDVKFFGTNQEWSIGYNVPTGGATIDRKSGGTRLINTLDLYEYSPVLFGAMPNARTVSVKSAQEANRMLINLDADEAMEFKDMFAEIAGQEIEEWKAAKKKKDDEEEEDSGDEEMEDVGEDEEDPDAEDDDGDEDDEEMAPTKKKRGGTKGIVLDETGIDMLDAAVKSLSELRDFVIDAVKADAPDDSEDDTEGQDSDGDSLAGLVDQAGLDASDAASDFDTAKEAGDTDGMESAGDKVLDAVEAAKGDESKDTADLRKVTSYIAAAFDGMDNDDEPSEPTEEKAAGQGFGKGSTVTWKWSGSTASGKVQTVIPSKVTRNINGTDVTKNGTEDNPCLVIKQEDGTTVLKLQSEVSQSKSSDNDYEDQGVTIMDRKSMFEALGMEYTED